MRFLQDISIRWKILIPSVLLIFLPILTMLIYSQIIFANWMKKEFESIAERKIKAFNNNINEITQRDLNLASFIASLPSIQETYQLYNKNKNLDECALKLDRFVDKINSHMAKSHNIKLKLHFHLPPATSFYRSWTSKKGDELSLLRKSIVRVTKTHRATSGLEIAKHGFSLRSMAPIHALSNNRYLGSVEVITSTKSLYNVTKSSKNEEIGLFVHQTKLDFAKSQMDIVPDSSVTLGRFFVQIDKPTNKFKTPSIDSTLALEIFDQGADMFQIRIKNKQYAIFKIYDINHEPLGLGVFQFDITQYIEDLKTIQKSTIILLVIFILIGVIVMLFTANIIAKPINKLREVVMKLGKGEIAESIKTNSTDEVGKMTDAINELVDGLKATSEFANNIGEGRFDANFKPLSEKDHLGNALIEMSQRLKKAKKDEEERKKQDEKLKWTNLGQAKFVEILRQSSKNLETLADNVIKGLVDYLGANQGGLFIYNDYDQDDIHLELIAAYAYDHKKFFKKRIKIGEGLAGMCALEKYTIFRKEIPNDYIKIRSGLGSANPSYLLIVPLKIEEIMLGVVEIASFKVIKPYQIEFVEKIAENIASSLSTVRINQRTSQLLEQSRKQAERLARQETEMRRNIEDMRQKQLEAQKNEEKAMGFIKAVNSTFLRADFNIDGTIIEGNRSFFETLQYLPTELEGENINTLLEDKDKEKFETIWNRLISGGNYYQDEIRFLSRHSRIWLSCIFTPEKDSEGDIDKIIFLGTNVDEAKLRVLSSENELKAINNAVLKAQYKPDGTIVATNSVFLETIGFSRAETQNTNVFDIINEQVKPEFMSLWEKVINGTPIPFIEKITTKKGVDKFFKGIYTSLTDYDGIISGVLYIGIDITKEVNKLKKDNTIDLSFSNEISIF